MLALNRRTEDIKRQRTTSGSASSNSQSKSRRQAVESEEENQKPERHKNIRGAAARNHRNKEIRDREAQREQERAHASGSKRRTARGRDDGKYSDAGIVQDLSAHSHISTASQPSPEPLSRTNSARGAKTNSTLFTAPSPPDLPPPKTSHKKTGRPPAKKSRVGRNQYTKDRDLPIHSDIAITNISPASSNSSHNADSSTPHINGNSYVESNGVGKPSKPRPHNANKTTMNDMKRRVAGILHFISATQVEMAGIEPPSTTKSSTSTNTPPDTGKDLRNGSDISGKAVNAALKDLEGIDEEAFAALSSVEMMEVLTRRLIKWQGEYGKPGER